MDKWHYNESFDMDENDIGDDGFKEKIFTDSKSDYLFYGEDLEKSQYIDENYIAPKPAITIRKWKVRIG